MKRIFMLLGIMLSAMSLTASITAAQSQSNRIDLSETKWKFMIDPGNTGLEKGWQRPEFDGSSWWDIAVPRAWVMPSKSDSQAKIYSGFAWYRRAVIIPTEWQGKKVFLNIGKIQDKDWAYVNGVPVGKTVADGLYYLRRSYVIPCTAIKYGQPNVIAIRVLGARRNGGIIEGPVSLTADKPDTSEAVIPEASESSSSPDTVKVGSDVFISSKQTVGDVVAIFGNVTVAGHVTGDVVAVFGKVIVESGGTVDGDAVAAFGSARINKDGKVHGNVVTVGGGVRKDIGAEVGKDIGSIGIGEWGGLGMALLLAALIGLVSSALFALLAMAVALILPEQMEMVSKTALEQRGTSALYGFIGLLMILPLALLLVATHIGAPLVVVEVLFVMAAWFFGKMGIGLVLGRKIAKSVNHPEFSAAFAMAVGVVAIGLIGLVPVVGAFIAWILNLIGFGAVLVTGFGTSSNWWKDRRKKDSTPPPCVPAGGTNQE